MPLLDKIMEKKIRLIDYECIRGENERLVAFGRYAGIAGACDFLRGIGEFLLTRKFHTAFVNVSSSYMYTDLDHMFSSLSLIGNQITKKGLPKQFAPYVFAVTSKGRVAEGALEVLKQLPHEEVTADQLETLPKDNKKIYIVTLTSEDLVKRKDGGEFNKAEYYDQPDDYEANFARFYDKISFLVQCMYWEPKYPKVVIEEELCAAAKDPSMKFMGLTDISADYEGSIGITRHFLEIEDPFRLYTPEKKAFKQTIGEFKEGDILFHCVDHLPAELPVEASNHFGEKLIPFIEALAKSNFDTPFDQQEDYAETIKNAVITCHGELTPKYSYIAKLREQNEAEAKKAKKEESKISHNYMNLKMSGHLFDTQFFN